MVYFKSLLVGLATLIITSLLSPFIMSIYVFVVYKPTGDAGIGWDPVSFAKRPLSWLIALVIFLTGFMWEFRRANSK